jgi:transcriptional regulator with XRE-family HTH domain
MELEKDWILENVKNIIAEKQLKVENISNAIGISKGEFSKILNGQRKDYFKYLPLLAENLGVSFHQLVKNEPKYNQVNNHQKGGTSFHNIMETDKTIVEKMFAQYEDSIKTLHEYNNNLKQERDNYKRKYENMKNRLIKLEEKK